MPLPLPLREAKLSLLSLESADMGCNAGLFMISWRAGGCSCSSSEDEDEAQVVAVDVPAYAHA